MKILTQFIFSRYRIFIYSTLQLCLLLGGCLGGGTIGTGVTSLSNHGSLDSGIGVKFTLETTLKDLSGAKISNAHIKIDTTHGTFFCVTNKGGICEMTITIASAEELKFTVVHGKSRYSGAQQISPAGKDRVERILFIAPNGAARFTDE